MKEESQKNAFKALTHHSHEKVKTLNAYNNYSKAPDK